MRQPTTTATNEQPAPTRNNHDQQVKQPAVNVQPAVGVPPAVSNQPAVGVQPPVHVQPAVSVQPAVNEAPGEQAMDLQENRPPAKRPHTDADRAVHNLSKYYILLPRCDDKCRKKMQG